jgi:hypothetical protein
MRSGQHRNPLETRRYLDALRAMIAQEHYWTVEDSDLDNVIEKLTPDLSQKLAIKLAIGDVFCGPESSLGVSTPMEGETKKAQEIPGFVALCRLLSSSGFTLRMGEEGLETLRKTQGKPGTLAYPK